MPEPTVQPPTPTPPAVRGNALRALLSAKQRPGVNWGVALAVLIMALLVPFITGGYVLFQLELVLIYIGAASGLNLAVGYAGEFLLCQATVIGMAAYVSGILSSMHNWSPIETFPLAIVAAIIWQLIISISGLRVRGLYLGILSFFSVLVFPDLVLLTSNISGGTGGLIGISPFAQPGSSDFTVLPFEIAVAVAAVSALIVRNLVVSGWGIRLRYLRDAPNSLASAGVNITRTKLTVYVVSAIPAALAGWALAYFSESLTSSVFGLSLTLILFAGVQLVRPGSIAGPIIGAGLLEGYSQLVGPFSQYNTLGLGALLTLALIVLPGGFGRFLSRNSGSAAATRRRRILSAGPVTPELNPLVELRRARQDASAAGQAENDTAVVLEVRDIVKSFGGNRAVDGAGFTVGSGRIVALMGENGSGKTTLVNIISGFLRPDSGQVLIKGRPTTGMVASQVARLGCARTFQVPQVVGELTVRENVEVGLLYRSCVGPARAILLPFIARRADWVRREAAVRICEEMGLSAEQIDQETDTLSLGMRRIVEVARAIASSADLICLDEPAAGLNDDEIDSLSQVLKDVRQTGEAILLVEHNARFVLSTCDDIILLRAGKVEAFFSDVDEDNLPPALQRHLRRATVSV